MAFVMVAGAWQDAQGRAVYSGKATRREQAGLAIKWLRSRTPEILGFEWCAAALGIDSDTLRRDGFARVPYSGMKNWRIWRERRRNGIRVRLPVLTRTCPQCHLDYKTRRRSQKFCNLACSRAYQADQQAQSITTYVHTCPACHRDYSTRNRGQQCCSVTCMRQYQHALRVTHYQERELQCAL